MESTINFYGTVVNGEMMHYRPILLKQHLHTMEGKEFRLTVTERETDNTKDQHGFYRYGIIRVTCMQTELFAGWRQDEIHDFFSDRFLTTETSKEIGGKMVVFRKKRSTSNLSKKQMAEFIQNVISFLADHGIHPLPPEEYHHG